MQYIEQILNLFLLQNLKTHIKLNVFKHIKEIIYIYIYIYMCVCVCMYVFFLIFNYSIKDIQKELLRQDGFINFDLYLK